MVMIGAYCALTGLVGLRRARRGDAAVDPVVPHPTHRGERARAARGLRAPARQRAPGMGGRSVSEHAADAEPDDHEPRHRHHRRRALQGLRALHPGVPAEGAHDVGAPTNRHGLPLPGAAPRLHGCAACLLVCPDFVFEVFRFDDTAASPRFRHDRDARPRRTARAHGGLARRSRAPRSPPAAASSPATR